VAVGRARGNAQELSRLIARQPREVAQLDQAGLEGDALGEPGEGGVRGQHVLVRLGGDEAGV
jgi:hypothetical protein